MSYKAPRNWRPCTTLGRTPLLFTPYVFVQATDGGHSMFPRHSWGEDTSNLLLIVQVSMWVVSCITHELGNFRGVSQIFGEANQKATLGF